MSERNFETIVEGGWYRRFDGKIVGPAKSRIGDVYHWEVDGFSYTDKGSFYGDDRVYNANLVARVNPDGTPWIEQIGPTTDPEKRLPQPGEKWLTRGGFVATVKRRHEADFYGRELTGTITLESGEAVARWRKDGHVSGYGGSTGDLIEYIGTIEQLPEPEQPQALEGSVAADDSLKVSRVGLEVADRKNSVTAKFTESGELLLHYSKRPSLDEIDSLSRCLAKLHEELSKEA